MVVKIGNETIANLFHIQDKLIAVNDHIHINWFDMINWIAQTIIAYFSGHILYDEVVKRALTRRFPKGSLWDKLTEWAECNLHCGWWV
jgi:hypothetical protein